jgi:hypothetical protein
MNWYKGMAGKLTSIVSAEDLTDIESINASAMKDIWEWVK